MKINQISLARKTQKEKIVFSFQRPDNSRSILKKSSNELQAAVRRAFGGEDSGEKDVWIDFELGGKNYILSAVTNAEGVTRRALKIKVESGKLETVAREKKVLETLAEISGCDLSAVTENCFASAEGFKEFVRSGSVRVFRDLGKLLEEADGVERVCEETHRRYDEAMERARRLTEQDIPASTRENIEKLFAPLKTKHRELEETTAAIDEIRRSRLNADSRSALEFEHASDIKKLGQLLKNKEYIDLKRGQLEAFDGARALVEKLKALEAEQETLKALKARRDALREEIDWQDGEFASITEQLVIKQAQADSLIAKKLRMEIAIEERTRAENLKRLNNELTDSLGKLNAQLDKLETKKVNLKNNLANVEQAIDEIRQSMESFNIPAQSIGELMDSVRAEVKIGEIQSQTDRLQTEIAAAESDVADKEMTISGQTKQLNSLMALDSTVAPLKAKDAIVRVVDAKIDKLTLINDSLKEKLNNYQRAMEDNGFREMRLEQSGEAISTVLVRKQFAKEEEFKRQILLARRDETDGGSVMAALPAQLDDPEIEALKSDLASRTVDRREAMKTTAMLKGAMGEISRHIAVNNAEIESLRQEKSNINRKYLELVAQNQAEATQQYLKSLETDSATKYLLSIQEDVVKNETELRSLKKDLEQKKGRLTELRTRLKYLSDSRREAASDEGGLELLMQTNEQIKNELADIGDRLALSYKQHKTILDTIDQLDNKRLRIQELIIETLQKLRANEREIVVAGEKVEEFAGGDIAERLEELGGELEEIESERNMLFDSKENLSRKVFDKRVELECVRFETDAKERMIEENKRALADSFRDSDKNEAWIRAIADLSDEDIEATRRGVKSFDYLYGKLTEKTEIEKRVLELLPASEYVKDAESKEKRLESRRDRLRVEIDGLEEKLDYELSVFVNTGSLKINLAQAKNEAEALSRVGDALSASRVAKAVLTDKVKSVVKTASALLEQMTDGRYGMSYVDGLKLLDAERKETEIVAMENTDRLLAYLSLLIAQPAHNSTKGNWLIIDERILCNRIELNKALRKTDNVVFAAE